MRRVRTLGDLAVDLPSVPNSLRAAPPRPRRGITSLVSTRIDQLIDAQAAPADTGFMGRVLGSSATMSCLSSISSLAACASVG